MKKTLFLMAILTVTSFAGQNVKAQDSVFSYTHQGTTLYYIIDSAGDASVVPPLYPYLYFDPDTVTVESWDGHSKPQGAVVIPDSVPYGGSNHAVTAIDFCALYLCDSITSITLPSTLRYIDSSAFEGCTRMEAITIPSVTSIDYSAFYHCKALQTVALPEGLTTLEEYAFSNCYALESVTLPSTLTSMGSFCFRKDTMLTSIAIPGTLQTINYKTFYNCSNLQSVMLPSTLTTIGASAFENCYNLQSVTLPSTQSSMLTSIDNYAFSECHSLQSLTLPESLNTIGNLAFYKTGLTEVVLPEGLTSLGIFAFSDCGALQSVRFPSTLDAIGGASFQGDTSLTSVIIPEGVDTIHQWAFYDCKSLPTVTLPMSLKYIGQYTFTYCTSLNSVYCPDSIRYIGPAAFAYCTNLTTFRLPEQLDQVSGWLLYGTDVREVVVPSNVTFIDTSAFSACQQLHKVTLPASLTTLGEYVFDDGTHLDTIILLRSVPPSAYNNDFTEFTATLVVPCGTAEAYRQHSVWGRFANITEDCTGIDEIASDNIKVYTHDGRIVVEGADNEIVQVFDMAGRITQTFRHSSNQAIPIGVYLVKVGQHIAKKVIINN